MRIVPIVEGHGDYEAVPVLLRRIVVAVGADVGRPIRHPKSKLVREDGLRRAVRLAAINSRRGDGILVLFDADEDCPASLGQQVRQWAASECADRRVAVVLAKREFEAWFLASAPSLVAAGKLPVGTHAPVDAEAVADPKGWLSDAMGRRYSETIDQPAFAAMFDLQAARGCPSFDKLAREVLSMVQPDGTG